MRAWPVLLLCTLALAGCSDKASGDGADPGMHGGDGMVGFDVPAAPAPTWAVGDYWSYKDNLGQQYSLVVAADAGTDWTVLTNDKNIARFDALFDISFVGKVRKADLAGAQDGERIEFFDFPLEDGKEWTTVWDGQSRHVVAHGLQDGTYHVVAHIAGNEVGDKHADYIYDPAVGHFRSISFFDANGTVAYAAESTGSGHDFSGTLYRFGPTQELVNLTTAPGGYTSQTFQVEAARGELGLTATIDCAGQQGAVFYAVQAPQEDGSAAPAPPTPIVATVEPVMGNDDPCPDSDGTAQAVLEDPPAGAWRYDAFVGDAAGSMRFRATWTPREDIPVP